MQVCLAHALLIFPIIGFAAEDTKPAETPRRPWSDKATLSYISVDGNAKSQSFGFANEYKYTWSRSSLVFKAGGVRVGTRSSTGPPPAPA